MFLELMIISVCAQNRGGCTESSEAYYKGSPELQQMAKNGEKFAKQNIPAPILEYVLPVAGAAVGKKASIKLSTHWAIEIDKSGGGSVMLKWTF